jgi:hypothetical protein
VVNVTHGSLSLNADGGFTYTPSPGYSGPDSFTYRANDGTADSNTATVSLTVTPGLPVNHPPVANAGGSLGAVVGSTLQLGFIGSCTDADGDATTRSWSVIARPQGSSAPLVVDATPGSPSFVPECRARTSCSSSAMTAMSTAVPSVLALTVTPAPPQNAIFVGSLSLTLGQEQAFTVVLSTPAPAGGLTVSLTSSDTNVATVPASTFIAAGATAPPSIRSPRRAYRGRRRSRRRPTATKPAPGFIVVAALTGITVTNTNDSGCRQLAWCDCAGESELRPEHHRFRAGRFGNDQPDDGRAARHESRDHRRSGRRETSRSTAI